MSLIHTCTGLICTAVNARSCLNMTPGSVIYQDNPKNGTNITNIFALVRESVED